MTFGVGYDDIHNHRFRADLEGRDGPGLGFQFLLRDSGSWRCARRVLLGRGELTIGVLNVRSVSL